MQFPLSRLLTRATWLKVHLYLALSVGFLFALIGLTGSLSVYRDSLDTLFNPELVVESPHGSYQSLDKIMAAVKAAHPDRSGSWTLELPSSANGMITAWYEKPRETFFELYAPLMVSVNPYTAEVVSNRFWGQTTLTWLLDLHTQLHLDRWGWNAVGCLGFLLAVSCLSGLYLWWPGLKGLRRSLLVRHQAGLMRFALDSHRLVGLLSLPALLVLAVTGSLLSYPSLLEAIAGSSGMEHGQTGRTLISTAKPNNHPTGLAAAVAVAQAPFPRAKLRRVTIPVGDTGIYRINFRQANEINQRHPYTTVWLDRWSGQIREVRDPRQFSQGEVFASWVWPLHTGEALGAWGRFCWFLAGLSVFVLYVSGLVRWLCRSGKMRDRRVNFAALRTWLELAKTRLRQLWRSLSPFLQQLAQQAKDYAPQLKIVLLKGGYGLYEQLFRLLKRQKRLGKD